MRTRVYVRMRTRMCVCACRRRVGGSDEGSVMYVCIRVYLRMHTHRVYVRMHVGAELEAAMRAGGWFVCCVCGPIPVSKEAFTGV